MAKKIFVNPNILLGIIVVIGVGLMIGGGFYYKSLSDFKKTALTTEGTIVDFVRSSSSTSKKPAYFPIVRYTTEDNQTFEKTMSVSASPEKLGETITILYQKEDPEGAEMDYRLYTAPIILLIMGAGFILIGLAIRAIAGGGGSAKTQSAYTVDVMADVTGVSINESFSMNGAHPYYITAKYKDPATGEDREVRSKNLWFDPTEYLPGQIHVMAHPVKKNKYWMDLSFLPQK